MSFDERGLIDLSSLTKRDYSKFLLSGNPFPSTAVPSDVPLTTADRKMVIRRFTDVLELLYSDGSSSITVLLGDYGSGKSHLFKLFKITVNSKLLSNKEPMLAIYVKSPGRNIRDLYFNLVDDCGQKLLTDLAYKTIFDILKKMDYKEYIIKGQEYNLLNYEQIPAYLEHTRVRDLFKEITRSLGYSKNNDIVQAFLYLTHSKYSSIAWRWFIGSSLSREEKQSVNIESLIDDSYSAERTLNDFITLLHIVGIKGIVLLIDEFEAITLVTGISKGIYQDALRHLIDNNPTGLILFFAITPLEWDKLTNTPTALERRLASSIFDLPPFNKDEINELIAKYLSISRPKDYIEKIELLKKDYEIDITLYPFSQDSIDSIFISTKGLAHKVIMLCRLCIDHLVEDSEKIIDSNYVKRVIEIEGFK
jgi:hypothetical protein